MNKNDPEIIDGAAIEETRPSRLPCLIKKIVMAGLVLGSISLLVLTYYSYVVLTSKIAQLENQVAALPEAFAAYTKPQSTNQNATESSPAHDVVVTEAARKEENAEIDSKQDELLNVIVAVSELRESARRGAPYDKELAVVEQRHDPVIAEKIAVIKPYAQSGIKDIAKLQESFKEMVGTIRGTQEAAQKNNGNLSDLSKQFSSLIKIRKINENIETGTSMEAVIMRTEKALNDADIAKAITELGQLQDEEIKKHSAAWLIDAEHSLAVMQQSEALYQYVIKLPLKGQP